MSHMNTQQDYDIEQQATLLFEERKIPLNKKGLSQLANLLAKVNMSTSSVVMLMKAIPSG
jgi:hypothetical protein